MLYLLLNHINDFDQMKKGMYYFRPLKIMLRLLRSNITHALKKLNVNEQCA